MKKTFYIIPGLEETCRRKPYKKLKEIAEKKGYEVVCVNIDWKKKLSKQIFPIEKDATVFGFSLGAILAWLVAQLYPCRQLILASMTPHYSFTDKKIKKMLIDLLDTGFINDIVKNLETKNKAKKQTIMYGDKEDEPGDILVKGTQHELTDAYLNSIKKLL